MKRNSLSLLGAVAFSLVAIAMCRAEGSYHLTKEIPVGGDGGWDYLSVDSARAPALRQSWHPGLS